MPQRVKWLHDEITLLGRPDEETADLTGILEGGATAAGREAYRARLRAELAEDLNDPTALIDQMNTFSKTIARGEVLILYVDVIEEEVRAALDTRYPYAPARRGRG
jgi:hypothetical protein